MRNVSKSQRQKERKRKSKEERGFGGRDITEIPITMAPARKGTRNGDLKISSENHLKQCAVLRWWQLATSDEG